MKNDMLASRVFSLIRFSALVTTACISSGVSALTRSRSMAFLSVPRPARAISWFNLFPRASFCLVMSASEAAVCSGLSAVVVVSAFLCTPSFISLSALSIASNLVVEFFAPFKVSIIPEISFSDTPAASSLVWSRWVYVLAGSGLGCNITSSFSLSSLSLVIIFSSRGVVSFGANSSGGSLGAISAFA